jgi:hypothetical protein
MKLLTALVLAHSFYAPECCQDRDCRPVPCSEITSIAGGWLWRGVTFKQSQLRTSPDGECHICTRAEHSFCIYLPPRV